MLVFSEINFLYLSSSYFSIHACLAWNQLSSSYPTSYIAVGWRLDDAHPFPGPTHSTGGGGLMGYDHDHGRGGGGGTRNLEHIYALIICILLALQNPAILRVLQPSNPPPTLGWLLPHFTSGWGNDPHIPWSNGFSAWKTSTQNVSFVLKKKIMWSFWVLR